MNKTWVRYNNIMLEWLKTVDFNMFVACFEGCMSYQAGEQVVNIGTTVKLKTGSEQKQRRVEVGQQSPLENS